MFMFMEPIQVQLRPHLRALVALNFLLGVFGHLDADQREDRTTRVAALFRFRGVDRNSRLLSCPIRQLLVVRTQDLQPGSVCVFPTVFTAGTKSGTSSTAAICAPLT